jgi:hypothetical protein
MSNFADVLLEVPFFGLKNQPVASGLIAHSSGLTKETKILFVYSVVHDIFTYGIEASDGD